MVGTLEEELSSDDEIGDGGSQDKAASARKKVISY